ncbi:MAG: amino acid racemase [Patescibacteria group bacterium]
MKTIGIIGGLGPQTTANFYMRIHTLTDLDEAGIRPHIIINSIPITVFLENENIIHERNFMPVLPLLIEASKSLEKAGADFIVLACNSLHIYEKEIAESVSIPFLSMVSATISYIKAIAVKKVGLLGTYKTNSSNMYTSYLKSAGIDVLPVTSHEQQQLSSLIIHLINNTYGEKDRKLFKSFIENLVEQGAERVILACTDFHLILDPKLRHQVIDTTEVLAQQSVKMMRS